MSELGPTDRELDVLKVLWELKEARVREVHEIMNQQEECAFTTVQTLLRIMADKGLVKQRHEERALVYTPTYTRDQVCSRFLRRVFDGALGSMLLDMLQAEKVSPDEMRQLEKLVAKARREKEKED